MEHTPEPWVIGYGGQEGDDYAVITSPHRERAICNLEPGDYEPGNARLIKMAPELLRACQDVLAIISDLFNQNEDTLIVCQKLEQVIAKAGGR